VVGRQYLGSHSWPEITFTVSQCENITQNPRRSHDVALERLGQYLWCTMEEGLLFSPTHTLAN